MTVTEGIAHLRDCDAGSIAQALDDPAVRALIIETATEDQTDDALGPVLRRLERSKPACAMLRDRVSGAALAVALACHRRLAAPDAVIASSPGFPVAGITQRMLRLAGFPVAVSVLAEGRALTAEDARAAHLVDAVMPVEALRTAATEFARATPAVTQPWDAKGFVIPGPDLRRGAGAAAFAQAIATIQGHGGANADAVLVLQAIHDGFAVPLDTALRLETSLPRAA